jgi:hypothetical protein
MDQPPPSAYVPNATLEGKATFGFVSKYGKGATTPTGNTEFQFKIANLNFYSENYDWLVVARSHAKYKGTGIINGEGNYGFRLSAVDGAIKEDGIDKFSRSENSIGFFFQCLISHLWRSYR